MPRCAICDYSSDLGHKGISVHWKKHEQMFVCETCDSIHREVMLGTKKRKHQYGSENGDGEYPILDADFGGGGLYVVETPLLEVSGVVEVEDEDSSDGP